MKYQLGDKVLLLHSNEEGEVVDIINDKMVLVDVDGVRFPVYTDQIDFPYFKRFSEKKMVPPKKEKVYIDQIKEEKPVKIKAKQLFQKIEEMKLKNEPAFSFKLFEKYPDKIEEVIPDYRNSHGQLYDVSRVKQKLEPARSVVDLHIEKLTDNWKGLSNFEILTIQLSNFEKYYNLAIAHRQPNLIVIHGVGTGKLRNEIHEILKTKREVKSFANQYHTNFGFGATEIFFQY